MIGVITSGSGFAGTEKYVEDEGQRNNKEVREIVAKGVDVRIDKDGNIDANPNRIARSFRLEADMNERVTKPVGHTSLSFHPDDAPMLTDEVMQKIALDYMSGMGIVHTQYHIVRHCEKNNPHCHIVWNRVDFDGKKIDDRFERRRNVKVCRELTAKYGLKWGKHKSKSKCDVNNPAEQERYAMSRDIQEVIKTCCQIENLPHALLKYGIIADISYHKQKGTPNGISFSRNGFRFKGSDIDRSLSCGNIQKQLRGVDVIKEMTAYQQEDKAQESSKPQHHAPRISIADLLFSGGGGKSQGHDTKDMTDLAKEVLKETLKL